MEDVGIKSTPISRFVNFKQFYFDMLPHLKELEKQNLVTSLLAARTIKKVTIHLHLMCSHVVSRETSPRRFDRSLLTSPAVRSQIIKKCTLKSVDLPDIVSYFTDSSKAAITQKFIHRTQFIIGSFPPSLAPLLRAILCLTRAYTPPCSAQHDGHCRARHATAVQLHRGDKLSVGAQQGGPRRLLHRLHLMQAHTHLNS
jgi:hypothetical protein